MAHESAGDVAPALRWTARTPLNRQQIIGFWAAWSGWLLDGMDSVIYALVLGPALTELLPRSGIEATPANIGFVASLTFGLFLVGPRFRVLTGERLREGDCHDSNELWT